MNNSVESYIQHEANKLSVKAAGHQKKARDQEYVSKSRTCPTSDSSPLYNRSMLPDVRVRLLIVLIAAVASNVILQAEPLGPFSSRGYVGDFANVLDPASAESLDDLCWRLDYWTGTQLNAITVQSLGRDSSQTYALKVFSALNAQSEVPESGKRRIVILFGAQEGKFTIIAGGEVRPILAGKVRRYQHQVLPYLRTHQYGPALALMTRRIAEDIAADSQVGLKEVKHEAPLGTWSPVAQPYDVLTESLRAMVVLWLIVIVGIVLVKKLRRRRPAKPALTFLKIGERTLPKLTT